MKHRVIVHSLNHTALLVDITAVGMSSDVLPTDGVPQSVPSRRFQNWNDAENYLLGLGADLEQLSGTINRARKEGIAVLTIVSERSGFSNPASLQISPIFPHANLHHQWDRK